MAVPDTVRVKLISDEAGAISFTPVVVQEMPARELLELIVTQVGKNAERLLRVLEGGTLVSGASRFRWEAFEVDEEEVRALLSAFPDPEPERPFRAENCVLAVFRGDMGHSLELPREAGVKRRLFRRRSFWEALLGLLEGEPVRYMDYSYREKADRFRLELSPRHEAAIREDSTLLAYSGLEQRLRTMEFSELELFVVRSE